MLRKTVFAALAIGTSVLAAAPSQAQYVTYYSPPVSYAPVTAYSPVVTAYSPVMAAPVATTAYYAPPVVAAAPPVAYQTEATVAYRVAAPPVAAAPVVAYSPVAAPVYAAPAYAAPAYAAPVVGYYPAPVVYGRPAIVRQRVYIPGQPLRNAVRVLLP